MMIQPYQTGDLLEVVVESMGAQARGVAHLGGHTLLVAGALAGERVEAAVEKAAAGHILARTVRVVTPSPRRTASPCPHYGECGGCDFLHTSYPHQLEIKRQAAHEQLVRLGGVTPPEGWDIAACSRPLGYRDRLDFTPTPQGEAGFHPVKGSLPVAVSWCRLAPPELSALAHQGLAYGQPGRMGREVSRLRVQQHGRGELALLIRFFHARDGERLAREAGEFLAFLDRAVDGPQGVSLADGHPSMSLTSASLTSVALTWPVETRKGKKGRGAGRSTPEENPADPVQVLRGGDRLEKNLGGTRYRVAVDGFFQTNPASAETLLKLGLQGVEGGGGFPGCGSGPVFDLYCGAGLFAIPLGAGGRTVAGVESHWGAVTGGREEARRLGLDNLAFHGWNLEEPGVWQRLTDRYGPPACVVADPPRRGLSKPLVQALAHQGPPRLVVVSCDPATFARDASRLADHYRLEKLTGVDMFPQTRHLELVGVFSRIK